MTYRNHFHLRVQQFLLDVFAGPNRLQRTLPTWRLKKNAPSNGKVNL